MEQGKTLPRRSEPDEATPCELSPERAQGRIVRTVHGGWAQHGKAIEAGLDNVLGRALRGGVPGEGRRARGQRRDQYEMRRSFGCAGGAPACFNKTTRSVDVRPFEIRRRIAGNRGRDMDDLVTILNQLFQCAIVVEVAVDYGMGSPAIRKRARSGRSDKHPQSQVRS